MPRSLRPESFPPEYEELLMVAVTRRGYSMAFPRPREAFLMRIRLYSYFKALRADSERSAKSLQLAINADKIRIAIADCELRITMRSESWDAEAIRESLELPPSAPPQALESQTSLLSRLSLIRQRKRQ